MSDTRLGGWGDLALRGNAGKAQQAQAKRGWGGAGRAARRIGAALCRDRGREGVKMRQKVGPQVSKAGIAAKRGRGRRDRGREGHKKKKTTTSGGLNGLAKGFIGRKRLVLAKDSA